MLEMSFSFGKFITDLCLVTNRIAGVKVSELTIGGHEANLWESSWRSKGKRLLGCYMNDTDDYVVTDIVVLPEDKDRDMDDYAGLLLTKDTSEKGLKKHIIYYRRELRKTATKAIEQLVLITPSKGEMVQPLFTAVSHTINEILITFKIGDIPKAQVSDNNVTTVEENLQQNNVNVVPMPASGIEGIPFQINSKYRLNKGDIDPVVSGMSIISLADIERKYEYAFSTEDRVVAQTS